MGPGTPAKIGPLPTLLVAWPSGRTSVFGRWTFPVLRSSCSWWVTTYVGKPSATGQPTRPSHPFILLRLINCVVSCSQMFASSHGWRHLVNAYGVKAWCGWLERWCVVAAALHSRTISSCQSTATSCDCITAAHLKAWLPVKKGHLEFSWHSSSSSSSGSSSSSS